MNKIKEKKLKSIKSEIEEIKNFISSKNNSEITENNFLDNSNNTLDDTLILNNIIRKEDKIINISDLNDIKKDDTFCLSAYEILNGANQSEVIFIENKSQKHSLFDKIFNFFD